MRTISSTLLTAQSAESRTPYIKMLFTSKNGLTTVDMSTDSVAFGDRIFSIQHLEEAYNEYAVVMLSDFDSTIPNISGYWTEIGYGMITGSGNEYLGTQPSRLWVKSQRHIAKGGLLLTVLELEGMWKKLSEQPILLGNAPGYRKDYVTADAKTVYNLLGIVLAEVSMTVDALGGVDDSIINTLVPILAIDAGQIEYGQAIIYRLLRLTKCFLRPQMGLAFKVVYPQAADAVLATYHRDTDPYFMAFFERLSALIPNHFYVHGNRGSDGNWTSIITGAAVSQTDIDSYMDVPDIALAPDFTTTDQCNLLAGARLLRARMEQEVGLIRTPHDGRIELYDKVAVVDNIPDTPVTYPTNSLTRVGGLKHIYTRGRYELEITLGGTSTTTQYTADNYINGRMKGEVLQPTYPSDVPASTNTLESVTPPELSTRVANAIESREEVNKILGIQQPTQAIPSAPSAPKSNGPLANFISTYLMPPAARAKNPFREGWNKFWGQWK